MKRHQTGFGIIAAVVILVLLGGLGAALARLGTGQIANSSQDLSGSRVWQTARAGIEWGLYQALRSDSCVASTTLSFKAEQGYTVTVNCTNKKFNEGESGSPPSALVKTIYSIDALACNANACPDATMAATPDYVERRLSVTACAIVGSTDPC
jgi:MSHA biogenesis protein MshP